jgi:predicted DNA-binding antitoxin AbrB/MazE fold protein
MDHTFTAIYENGMLRLREPLPYPEHTVVEVAIQRVTSATSAQQRARTRQALADAGLLVESTDAPVATPLNVSERARYAQALADAGVPPLSQAIVDEREER